MSHDSTLEPVLQSVEPRVRLVRERYLRQVLEFLEDAGKPQAIQSTLPLWVNRDDLMKADVLPATMLTGTEPDFLLITDPCDRLLTCQSRGGQLLAYWRLLFRAFVFREIDRRVAEGSLSPELCRSKLDQFGGPASREITHVLHCENLIPLEPLPSDQLKGFAGLYLELAEFEPERLCEYFPSLPSREVVQQGLSDLLDRAALVQASRPPGADLPVVASPDAEERFPIAPSGPAAGSGEYPTTGLSKQAREELRKGNFIRAAILFARLARAATGAEAARLNAKAGSALSQVVDDLGTLFTWDDPERAQWRQALFPLVGLSTQGFWPKAARCLYELQRMPADLNKELYAVDLPEKLRTFGRRPLKRFLPRARSVTILMHLRKAQTQMLAAGLSRADQSKLEALFSHQSHRLEESIRHELTPVLDDSLTRAGLIPRTTVEVVGRDKLVAELLDRVCERGFFRMSDLRDAVARNKLKMPDLSGVRDFYRDGLLRADDELTESLDGIYRRGEFYIRWIQRFSALFFGTRLGRLITIYLAIPFGGAFLALMFAEEVQHLGGKLITAMVGKEAKMPQPQANPAATPEAEPKPEPVQADHVEFDPTTGEVILYPPEVVTSAEVEVSDDGRLFWYDSRAGTALVGQLLTPLAKKTPPKHVLQPSFLVEWPIVLGFGFFLLLTIHVPPFRRFVLGLLGVLWYSVRSILWDAPRAVWQSGPVVGVRQSSVVRFLVRHFRTPTMISLLVFAILFLIGIRPRFILEWGWILWALLAFTYNSRWTWVVQDKIAEKTSDAWRILRTNLLPGILGTIIDWFQRLGNWFERQLYAVDEWLRFRGGDSQGSLAFKALLGLIWFPIAYAFRFIFYLLVEPQINPVKHFPVVTVSHKVIWPMVPQLADWTGLSPWTVGMFVNGVPGIFGFIAWELKENWKLYQANLPEKLKPVMIGSHGETMRRLLRPGFHSGTVPKLFRKLRRAGRSKVGRFHHQLDHVAESVRWFVERELLDLLEHAEGWGNSQVVVEAVEFGCLRVVVVLAAPDLGADRFILTFENRYGEIEAAVQQYGWADKLTDRQRDAFVAALRGVLDEASATCVNGRPRTLGPAPLGPGFEDLARCVSRDEWVARWQKP